MTIRLASTLATTMSLPAYMKTWPAIVGRLEAEARPLWIWARTSTTRALVPLRSFVVRGLVKNAAKMVTAIKASRAATHRVALTSVATMCVARILRTFAVTGLVKNAAKIVTAIKASRAATDRVALTSAATMCVARILCTFAVPGLANSSFYAHYND